jgi:peptidoglycan/LPS O-acetylase OafA/YrhL
MRFDGIRGLCAIGVIIYHYAHQAGLATLPGKEGPFILGRLLPGLGVFLPPFFVLSGFMLYRAFARGIIGNTPRPNARHFLVARAIRLMPVFWLVVLLNIVLLNQSLIDSTWELIKPFTLLFFLVTPSAVDWLPGIEHTWTVSTEMAFYAALPLIAWAIHKYARKATDPAARMRRMLIPLIGFVVIGAAWTAFCFLPSMMMYAFYYFWWPFGYIGYFAAGMALATVSAYRDVTGETPKLHRKVAARPMLWWGLALIVLILNVPKPFGERGMGTWGSLAQVMIEHVAYFTFAVLLVLPLTVPEAKSRFMDAVLTNGVMRYIGRLSYGVYIWHVPVMYLWFQRGWIFGNDPYLVIEARPQLPLWDLVSFGLFVIVGTMVLAVLSYHLIERPALKLRTLLGAPKSSLDVAYAPQK